VCCSVDIIARLELGLHELKVQHSATQRNNTLQHTVNIRALVDVDVVQCVAVRWSVLALQCGEGCWHDSVVQCVGVAGGGVC